MTNCAGLVAAITDLAATNDLNASYFTRLLRLAYLAPDIVEALEQGLRFDDDLLEVSADDQAVIDVRDSAEGE